MTDEQEKLLAALEDPASPAAEMLDTKNLKLLLSICTSTLDWETQERVEALLARADPETWTVTVLEEMPRLLDEAPAWAVSLLGDAIENNLPLVQQCLDSMPATTRQAVREVMAHDDFTAFYAGADVLLQ